jgi:hypothetical protein
MGNRLITYSLFNAGAERFEMDSYIRGFYWNARMNNLIYPDWRTHIEVDRWVYDNYRIMFDWLVEKNWLSLHINDYTPPLCEGMLWRLKPLFTMDITAIMCRDADSITTYKEAQAIQEWFESEYSFHAINDNPAHGGLMGGMVAFKTAELKAIMRWDSFEGMIFGQDLSKRGSDQDFLNSFVLPKIKDKLLLHCFEGGGVPCAHKTTEVKAIPPLIDRSFWESNLVCRHIGSAGVVEMELLRFFKRFDKENSKYFEVERKYPKLFYWL